MTDGFLIMDKPPGITSHDDPEPVETTWWHGTSVENAKSILADRLRGRAEQGRSSLAPLPGRVYVTRDFGLALTHAFGGLLEFGKLGDPSLAAGVDFHHYHKPTGAILQVRVGACVPDEDWLGELLLDVAQGSNGAARRLLSDEGKHQLLRVYWLVSDEATARWKRSRFPWDIATWARAGKVACNQLLKTRAGRDALAGILPYSPHAACLDTNVQVLGAWSLTQDAAKRLRPDGSNLAEVGVRLDAPVKATMGSSARSTHGADLLQRGAEALPDCLGSIPPQGVFPRWETDPDAFGRTPNLREVAPGLYVGAATAVLTPPGSFWNPRDAVPWDTILCLNWSEPDLGLREALGGPPPALRAGYGAARVWWCSSFIDGNRVPAHVLDDVLSLWAHREGPMLIHCHWGLSRSASVAAGLLRLKFGLSRDAALERVRLPGVPLSDWPRVRTFDSAMALVDGMLQVRST